MKKILVLNGPNLNLLGLREPGVYGVVTLQQIHNELHTRAINAGCNLEFFQSNHEGFLVDKIQTCLKPDLTANNTDKVALTNKAEDQSSPADFIIINPAAYTHTSIALRDALLAVKVPFIEVHLSNVHAREPFRHHSYLSDIALGVICGLGSMGYTLALDYALNYLLKGNK